MLWSNAKMNTICLPQEWLQMGHSLEELESEFKIKHKRHGKFPNLVQLKYSQIESDFNNALVRQCRGIILDEADNWKIVAWPFDKFGNYGEGYAADLDWDSARIQEKLDGSLIIMYYYDNEWHVATSGMPDAAGQVNGFDATFNDLFWTTFAANRLTVPLPMQRNLTFMFELTSPMNRVVVRHSKSTLTLIGVRDRNSGQEHLASEFLMYPVVREFGLKGIWRIDDIKESFGVLDPTSIEGYVVLDKDFNRLKVKHPGYVILHHLRDNLTPKGILGVVITGEVDEVIANFPEWKQAFEVVKARYEGLCIALETEWKALKDIEPRKDFAFLAQTTPVPAVMFLLKDDRIKTAKDGLAKMHIDKLMGVLAIKDALSVLDLPFVVEKS